MSKERENCGNCKYFEQGDIHEDDGKCTFSLPEQLPFWLVGKPSVFGKNLIRDCAAHESKHPGEQHE